MPDYATSQVELIDSRVAAGWKKIVKMGTVQSRDATGARAMVSLHGSSGVAQPVKCFENVIVGVGDRVGLVKFEGDWIIVGNYTLRTLGDVQYQASVSGTTTGAAYVDMPSSPAVTLTKYRDTTTFQITAHLSAFATVANTGTRIGVRITHVDGLVDYDENVIRFISNTASEHQSWQGSLRIATTLPAGVYTVTLRWLRLSGTGVVTVDGNDLVSLRVQEVIV
jgi:hypothetical protein